jgi:hypothetical protein
MTRTAWEGQSYYDSFLSKTATFDPICVIVVCIYLSSESVKALLLKGKAPVDPECTAKVGKVSGSRTDSQSIDFPESSVLFFVRISV